MIQPQRGPDAGREVPFECAQKALNYVFNQNVSGLDEDAIYPVFRNGEQIDRETLSKDAQLDAWVEQRDEAQLRLSRRKRR